MSAPKKKHCFLKHEQMDFEVRAILGSCYEVAADAGEILATAEKQRNAVPGRA